MSPPTNVFNVIWGTLSPVYFRKAYSNIVGSWLLSDEWVNEEKCLNLFVVATNT